MLSFIEITDHTCTADQVHEMERRILEARRQQGQCLGLTFAGLCSSWTFSLRPQLRLSSYSKSGAACSFIVTLFDKMMHQDSSSRRPCSGSFCTVSCRAFLCSVYLQASRQQIIIFPLLLLGQKCSGLQAFGSCCCGLVCELGISEPSFFEHHI